MDENRFANVQQKHFNPDPIIRVRCTKPKKDKMLTLHITRNGPVQKYTEVIFASELPKYGFSEWTQIQDIVASHKGIHAQELKLALNSLIEKC